MQDQILVLNKHYFPISVSPYRNVFSNLATESQYALDVHYELDDDGAVNFESIEYWNVIKSIDEWLDLPIRPYDDFIHSVCGPVRLPTVVVCAEYTGIMNIKAKFPTKQNIWERDKFTCVYTGEKLNRETLSIDHVIPKSKGGGSTWENLVTCQRILNSNKGSKTLKEAKLKLQYRPFKPADGHQFDLYRQEWHSFVANM
tara:strand:- start:590 stop:1189 length:600 start_codon:yes stop_codon:yes gene_type:complete